LQYYTAFTESITGADFILIIFFCYYIAAKMEVNNNGQNNQIIFPQNLKKYSGSIYQVWSTTKDCNKIISFRVLIKTADFLYQKNFPSRQDAESELIRLNHENKLDIKNVIIDKGDHYSVRLPGNKEFLADKCDLHFIEAHIWSLNKNYVTCNQNGKQIRFHNLILGHTPIMNCSVDHINRNSLDNKRSNLRLATCQTQRINQIQRKGAIRPGVCLNKNYWRANWRDENAIRNTVSFSINKYGYEAAKQLAIAKRLEMELSLNHYRLALHNLGPLELQEPEVNYNFEEQGELEPNVPDDEQDEI